MGIAFGCPQLNYGTYSAALGILTCCLAYEGWVPRRDEAEDAFTELLHSLRDDSEESVRKVSDAIGANWDFTAYVDRSGFEVVERFKEQMLESNRSLDSLFV